MRLLNISAVSYLNTKPFLFGLNNSSFREKIKVRLDYPAAIAQQLKKGEADIALIPVAAIPQIKDAQMISEYCIGSEKEVGSVCLYSEKPLDQIKEIFLDYQSRTSVELLKLLLKDHWKQDPVLLPSYPGYEEDIHDATAGLIIGDRSFEMNGCFPYRYDLGKAWNEMTRLPFVFAAWVARQPLPEHLINDFNAALKNGIDRMDDVIALYANEYPFCNVDQYLKKSISYELTTEKRKGMKLFLSMIGEQW